jgi:predicted O-methyltransferase YrrM
MIKTVIAHLIESFDLFISYKDKKFVNLISKIKKEIKFLLLNREAYLLFEIVKNAKKISGSIAEVGCYQGGSTKIIAEVNKEQKKIYVFDTFEGLLDVNSLLDPGFKNKQYEANYKKVKKYLKRYKKVILYKGYFPKTSTPIKKERFSFVHLDVDIYKSTLESLQFFYPRLNKGGIILSHDYYSGVKKAFDEFFKDKPEVIIPSAGTYCLVVKL